MKKGTTNKQSEQEKPKGWANLKNQLDEIRNESFKQGIWEGQAQERSRIIEIYDSFNWFPEQEVDWEKQLKILRDKITESKQKASKEVKC